MNIPKATIAYISRFLLGGDGEDISALLSEISYGKDNEKMKTRVRIVASSFFEDNIYGTRESLPQLPLPVLSHRDIDGLWVHTPLLFGTPEVEMVDNVLIIHADVVASTFFLLSRYEEYVRRDECDVHGRFPGKSSLPFRLGVLQRPIVDEYGRWFRKKLRDFGLLVPEPTVGFRALWLTSDLDIPFLYRSVKGLIRGCLPGKNWIKRVVSAGETFLLHREKDPAYTYSYLLNCYNEMIASSFDFPCRAVWFFKSGQGSAFDKPFFSPASRDMQHVVQLCGQHGVEIGLHTSYMSSEQPQRVGEEKSRLERATRQKIRYNRYHFLACREPEDALVLPENGLTDDFTMGYADVAGFRLGTCRPVTCILPTDKQIYPLTFHPLTLMEGTLYDQRYMNLPEKEALEYSLNLLSEIYKFRGEIVFLFHNYPLDEKIRYLYKVLLARVSYFSLYSRFSLLT
jgi:hypothetical protein